MARTELRRPVRLPRARRDARRAPRAVRAGLEQAAYAEQHGIQALMLSEHHVSADGYLPSPIPVAAAFAAVTSTIPISVAALLVNLYDPIRLAEEIAVLDHLSGGRVNYTLGLGYRREEYDLFGVAWETRGADIEARIRRMLDAWANGTVTPGPVLAAAPDAVLRRRLGGRRQARCAPRPALPAAGRRARAQGGLRGRVPRPGSRAGLHAARADRSRQRLLRRRPGPRSGPSTATACWPTPRGTPPGGRPTRRRTSATTRRRSRRCEPPASTSCTPPTS